MIFSDLLIIKVLNVISLLDTMIIKHFGIAVMYSTIVYSSNVLLYTIQFKGFKPQVII